MTNIDVTALTNPLHIGNGVDRLTIEPDGSMKLEGSATAYDDLQGPITGANLYSVAGKADYDFDEQCVVLQPDGSITTLGDIVDITLQLRHRAVLDTPLKLHIHWEQPSAVARTFTFKYRVQGQGQPKVTTWSSNIVVNTATAGVNSFTYTSGTLNQISRLGDISTTGKGLSSMIQIKLARTDANAGNINATFIDCHYAIDSLGSREELIK